jgi:tetratricopeptide (TPR) repeat protein
LLGEQGLLLAQGDGFTLHPLVAELVRSRVTEKARVAGHEGAIGYFEANVKPASAEMVLEDCQEEFEIFHHACEIGDHKKAFSIYGTINDFLGRRGFYREQVGLLERLVSKWPSGPENASERGACFCSLGIAYGSLGQYQRAIDFQQQSLEIKREIGDRDGEGGALCNLGIAYGSLGQYQQAIDFYQEALPIQREAGNQQFEANSLGGLGNAYQSLGEYQRAIDFQQQSLEIKRKIGDRIGEAASLGNLGNAYQALGQYQRAIDLHRQHNEIAREIGDRHGEANSLGSLGNAYDSLGQYQRAIDLHQQYNEIAREIGDRSGEAKSLGNLGNAYQSLGEYQRAIDYYQQSLEIAREIGDHWEKATSIFNIANSLTKLDNHFQALLNYQAAQAIYEELKLDHDVKNCKQAIRNLNQFSTPQHQAPPTVAIPKAKPQNDWWDRNLPANERKAAATRQSSGNFWWLFATGFALAILIYWLRR